MVKVIRMYTGLGFTVEDLDDDVKFESPVAGNWYLDGMLMLPNSDTYICLKSLFPGHVTFEAKVGNEFKRHTKWVEF